MKKIMKKIVLGSIWLYYKVVHRFKVEGQENIPKDGALIFCANHKSFLDPPLIKITSKREAFFLYKASLANNKFLAFMGKLFDEIPVKSEDGNDVNAIKTSLKHLKNNECIALFPEGTRNGLAKGKEVENGAAFFAVRSGAKVVPIGITGTMKSFCKLTISYGKPLDFREYSKDQLSEATKVIMDNILSLVK